MKHSNAPWFITKTDAMSQGFGFGYRIENKTNMSYLASVNGISENEICIANAKLMAAAPELLNSLITLLNEPRILEAMKLSGAQSILNDNIAIAKLAIKKAIGDE